MQIEHELGMPVQIAINVLGLVSRFLVLRTFFVVDWYYYYSLENCLVLCGWDTSVLGQIVVTFGYQRAESLGRERLRLPILYVVRVVGKRKPEGWCSQYH